MFISQSNVYAYMRIYSSRLDVSYVLNQLSHSTLFLSSSYTIKSRDLWSRVAKRQLASASKDAVDKKFARPFTRLQTG